MAKSAKTRQTKSTKKITKNHKQSEKKSDNKLSQNGPRAGKKKRKKAPKTNQEIRPLIQKIAQTGPPRESKMGQKRVQLFLIYGSGWDPKRQNMQPLCGKK